MHCPILCRVTLAALVLAVTYVCVQACPYHDRLRRLQEMQRQRTQQLQSAREQAIHRVRTDLGGRGQHSGHHNHAGHSRRPAPVSSSYRRIYGQRRPITTTRRRIYRPNYAVNGHQSYVGSYYVPPAEHNPCPGSSVYFCPVGTFCQRRRYSTSYQCVKTVQSCGEGFNRVNISETRFTCRDIDECADDNLNNCEQTCVNTHGAYKCRCGDGFEVLPDGRCQDIDECANPLSCQHQCHNTEGSYSCSCPEGYNMLGVRKCLDIDECETEDICASGERCLNLKGGHECYGPKPCAPGYSRQEGEDFGACIIDDYDSANETVPVSISDYRYPLPSDFPAGGQVGVLNFPYSIRRYWILDGDEFFSVWRPHGRQLIITTKKNLNAPGETFSFNIAVLHGYRGPMSWFMMDFVMSPYNY